MLLVDFLKSIMYVRCFGDSLLGDGSLDDDICSMEYKCDFMASYCKA